MTTNPEHMANPISYNATLVLQALTQGHRYGFEIMRVVSLPSGTVYPLLRRLEAAALVRSRWENEEAAHGDRRPARRYYDATDAGRAALVESKERIVAQQNAVFGLANQSGS